MKLTHLLSATAIAAALATGATAAFAQPASPAPDAMGSMAPAGGSMNSNDSMKSGSMKGGMMHGGMMQGGMMSNMDRFGGPVYTGAPDLPVTVAVVTAGNTPGGFSTAKALTAMVGPDLTNAEVGKLTQQFGKDKVDSFITVFNFAVDDAVGIVKKDGIALPAAAPLPGKAIAAQLVSFGTADSPSNRFWTGDMLDHLLSHKIHDQVMDDIDKKYGAAADQNYHVVSNQAFYDVAEALNKG